MALVKVLGAAGIEMGAREPAGFVGAVVPWNFPLTPAGWKVAPAPAAGRTAVPKSSEDSPLSALLLARIATEAGLPPGVLNVVDGDGPVAGRTLGLHPDVDVPAFTGSTAVGRHFLRCCAGSDPKRVWLELGDKSPNTVLPDAPDLAKAAVTAAWDIFFDQDGTRTAPSRLLVHSSIAEEVTEHGLAAGLWTSDLSTAHRASRALKAGTVWGNRYEEGDLTVPFGGMKQPGDGRDKSVHALEKYTEPKTTWIQL